MSSTRTFTEKATSLELRLPTGTACVTVTPDVDRVTVTLSAPDDTGPAADAIAAATESVGIGRYLIRVPEIATSAHSRIRDRAGNVFAGPVAFEASNITFNAAGGMFVNGDNYSAVNSPRTGSASVPQISAEVLLPLDTALSILGRAVTAEVTGHMPLLHVETVSGRIRAASVHALSVHTTSCDVEADVVLGPVSVRSVSGALVIGSYHGPEAWISTVSGLVSVAAGQGATGALNAETVSGDLDLRGISRLAVSASTISGHKSFS